MSGESRFGNRIYKFKIGDRAYLSSFVPISTRSDKDFDFVTTFKDLEQYKQWLTDIGLTCDEIHAFDHDPAFRSDTAIDIHLRKLRIPNFGISNKTLYSHFCITCAKFLSLSVSSNGTYKVSNGKVHCEKRHKTGTNGTTKTQAKGASTKFSSKSSANNKVNNVALQNLQATIIRFFSAVQLPSYLIDHPLLTDAMQQATRLDPSSWQSPGASGADRFHKTELAFFVYKVRILVQKCRDYAAPFKQPFLTLMTHENQSTAPRTIGYSMAVVDPDSMELTNVALGIVNQPTQQKTTFLDTLQPSLNLYGISAKDVFAVVSDTSPKLSGNHSKHCISAGCPKYAIDCALRRALGFDRQYSFAPGMKVVDRMRHTVETVCKSQATVREFVESSTDFLPTHLVRDVNDDAMSIYKMALSIVKNTHAIIAASVPGITEDDFQIIAEFEALLRPINDFAQAIQNVAEPVASYAILMKALLRSSLYREQIDVVHRGGHSWTGTSAIAELPTKSFGIESSAAPQSRLHDTCIKLRKRLIDQFHDAFCEHVDGSYRIKATDDELLAMILDPVFLFAGRSYFKDTKNTWDADLSNLWDRAVELLEETYTAEVNAAHAAHTTQSSHHSASLVPKDRSEIILWLQISTDRALWAQYFPNIHLEDLNKLLEKGRVANGLKYFLHGNNRAHFPVMHRIAIKYLCKPASNAFQHKVFPPLKYYVDMSSMDRLTVTHTQKRTLLSMNQNWLQGDLATTEQLDDCLMRANVIEILEDCEKAWYHHGGSAKPLETESLRKYLGTQLVTPRSLEEDEFLSCQPNDFLHIAVSFGKRVAEQDAIQDAKKSKHTIV